MRQAITGTHSLHPACRFATFTNGRVPFSPPVPAILPRAADNRALFAHARTTNSLKARMRTRRERSKLVAIPDCLTRQSKTGRRRW